jgi:hypothetical protein
VISSTTNDKASPVDCVGRKTDKSDVLVSVCFIPALPANDNLASAIKEGNGKFPGDRPAHHLVCFRCPKWTYALENHGENISMRNYNSTQLVYQPSRNDNGVSGQCHFSSKRRSS